MRPAVLAIIAGTVLATVAPLVARGPDAAPRPTDGAHPVSDVADLSLAPSAHGAGECALTMPVDAAVADPFRAPEHRFGPGNRGIEYRTQPGQRVVAAAAGRVDFAGPVAGNIYVVVRHTGDRRTSYGPLVQATVVRGQRVDAGVEIGEADAGFHLTLRIGDVYHDPAPALAGHCGRVRLLPAVTLTKP